MNIDLHCHSNISDGIFTPAEVVQRARQRGIDVLALTDHDELRGLPEAQATAEKIGLRFINGVEISVTWAATTVHIVGLRVDPQHPILMDGLHHTRSGRDRRGHEIAAQLAAVGIPDAFNGALNYVGNPDLISRAHFARYIVELGICKDVREVFTKYLIEGKPGYVPHQWATLAEAVGWITAAGGQAVIAHPARYKLDDLQHDALFDEFIQLGGEGVEVVTGSHTPAEYRAYAKVALRYGLKASRGSDFHTPGDGDTEFGLIPPLPENLTPIWHDWF